MFVHSVPPLLAHAESLHDGPRGQAALALPRLYMGVCACGASELTQQAMHSVLQMLVEALDQETERNVATSILEALEELFAAALLGDLTQVPAALSKALRGACASRCSATHTCTAFGYLSCSVVTTVFGATTTVLCNKANDKPVTGVPNKCALCQALEVVL